MNTTAPRLHGSTALRAFRCSRLAKGIQLMCLALWSLGQPLGWASYEPDPVASPPWSQPPIWQGTGPAPEEGADMGQNDYDTLPNWYELAIGTSPYNPDTDADLILDSDELAITGTNPLLADTNGNGWTDYEDWSGQSLSTSDPDNDGVENASEITAGTNPRAADTDGDGLADGYELSTAGQFNPLLTDTDGNGVDDYHQQTGATPAQTSESIDSDSDCLSDVQESHLGTHPGLQDSDGDGLADGAEVSWGSSPLSQDTDGDGAADLQEQTHLTHPTQVDTDGDGLTDGLEISLASSSYSPLLADSDYDGVNDYQAYTGQPPPPSTLDSDSDGLPDVDEFSRGTSPTTPDTDADSLLDGLEISWGSNPLAPDTDGDQLPDGMSMCSTPTPRILIQTAIL